MKQALSDTRWSRYNLKIFFKRRKARLLRNDETEKCVNEIKDVLNSECHALEKFVKLSGLQTRACMIACSPLPSYLSERKRGQIVLPKVESIMIKANSSGIYIDEKKIVNAIKELHVARNTRPC